MLGSYDSPTFLSQKDKYLLGLSLPQLMGVLGIGAALFLTTLGLPWGLTIRMGITLGGTALGGIILFGRIQGLMIPIYLALLVTRSFVRPAYEDVSDGLRNGPAVWRQQQAARQEAANAGDKKSRMFGILAKKRQRLESDDLVAKRGDVEAAAKQQATQVLVDGEQWVRDGIRSFIKSP